MNLRCIAQTAAILGRFGNKWRQSPRPAYDLETAEYFKNSLALFSVWSAKIQKYRSRPDRLLNQLQLAEEILAAELLTRTMAAELLVLGERTGQPEPTRIAFKTMGEHHQCRKSILDLIERQPNGVSTLLRCQRLARKIERWTDLMISPLTDSESATHAAYEEERCLDFGDQWDRETPASNSNGIFQIQLASLTVAIPNIEITDSACLVAHRARSTAALSFIAPEPPILSPQIELGRLCQQVSSGHEITANMLSRLN